MNNLFNEANELRSFEVKIGDIGIIPDTILSLEVVYQNHTPIVTGNIIINDLYNLKSVVSWEDSLLSLQFVDLFDEISTKVFRIMSIKDVEHGIHRKAIYLTLQDEFSYALVNSFLSKSYNNTLTNAFREYIAYLGFDSIETEISDITETKYFTIPKNISNLEFFTNEFRKYGYVFYQNRNSICVKSQEDISVASLPLNGIFTNHTDNQLYENIIHDIDIVSNDRGKIIPKTRSLSYDKDLKKVVRYSDNDKSKYSLNTFEADIQNTSGYKDICQQDLNFGNHDYMVRDSFLKQYHLEMVVNGYNKNNVNQIYDLIIRGNTAVTDDSFAGAYETSGKYVSAKVIDKIITNKLIQKIYLERADRLEKL